ncbi:DNA polymerase III subunit alpha [Planosporangium flavigriseum]|uniref:DNA polymerase III subunit alpha n=1 Tax=Planosporangium flavigriseum TaxID=373681 RepID=A0A8J3LIE4_9ACTN|nr:DNA polymerase III subunit alpha [Planosporangium flavigriseum]NJC65259.1 DNA polymerase III subunit alpha [Planosporangium flavigriseum]GIG71879.1 DNA polymerase III subunit alpha [Planosporangium flavigriseum]
MTDQFVHLHVHSEYSMLDGAARLKEMFGEAKRLGMPAVAITDHGNMHGANDFYKQAVAAEITPVIGVEAYLAPASRFDKKRIFWGTPEQKRDDVSGNGAFTHMTMWARNAEGLHNLFRLNSRASIEGHYVKGRMDAELIAEHSAGIMATTGCPSGEVQTRLRLGQPEAALAAAAKYQDIFGKENLFLELMDHGLEIEKRVRDGLLEIGRKLGIPPVVTNDSHYTFAEQRDAHDALLCVQTGSNLSDPNRFSFDGNGYYIKSAAEMYAIDQSDAWQEGCRNTLLIASRVETKGMFEFYNLMPKFPVPEGETEESWFRKEVWRGMDRRWPEGYDEEHRKQAEYELDIICQMGFPAYFLVVADFIMWAKDNGIPVGPGRGSAAGSLAAYALGITDLDPLAHGLIFERFLNPERVSMPDVDIDFDERRRGEVIKYVTERWGSDRVAQIATFGTIKAKAAIKDGCRVLGYPYALGDKITKAMPPAVMGKDIPLSGIFDPKHPRYAEAAEVRQLVENEPDVAKVMEVARGLEGLVRQLGVHAAGVIMSAEPLIDHVPLIQRDADGAIITQFDYPTCESLGLLKMDFLGLRNLTIIDDAVKNIEATTGQKIDLLKLPLDDRPTYELLGRGDTLGVFQLDGGGMRQLLRLMKPDNFEDISAALALYRPGPMGANSHTNYALRKNGLQEVTPIHPELEEPLAEILDVTYGLIIYQEQVQRAAQKLAGYSLGKADNLRRAMGKKKKEVLEKEFVPFRQGMRDNGYSDEAIQKLWDILVPFADYAFNKAHTACYGMISYWTGYLKANYPAEYMAALLTSVGDKKDTMALYLAECRTMGIKVLPPCVNESSGPFTPVGENIRFGLGAVRNVGTNVVTSIVETRKKKSSYTSFADFLSKSELVACNKRTVESLIKAGAFDGMNHTRRDLIAHHEAGIDAVVGLKRQEAAGQFDLFGSLMADDEADSTPVGLDFNFSGQEWPKKEKLAFERDMLGLYVSDHPLAGTERILKANSEQLINEVLEEDTPDRKPVVLAGMISGITRKITKQGATWAIVNLEDLSGSVEVLFFPKSYELLRDYLIEDTVVKVTGHVSKRDGATSVFGQDMALLDVPNTVAGEEPPVTLVTSLEKVTPELANELRQMLTAHRGDVPVHLRLRKRDGGTLLLALGPDFKVSNDIAFRSEVKMLLGAGGIE